MKEPTMEEMLELVRLDRFSGGELFVREVLGDVRGDVYGSVIGSVCGDVCGSIKGSVWASVWGGVNGKINGRDWEFVETPKEKAIRLIREGRGEEAIKVLEEE